MNRRVFLLMMPKRGHNITSATDYGKMIGPLLKCEPVLSVAHGRHLMMRALRNGLAGYTSADSILLLGNPIVIGLATLIASEASPDGWVRFLKWDNLRHCYDDVLIDTQETGDIHGSTKEEGTDSTRNTG